MKPTDNQKYKELVKFVSGHKILSGVAAAGIITVLSFIGIKGEMIERENGDRGLFLRFSSEMTEPTQDRTPIQIQNNLESPKVET